MCLFELLCVFFCLNFIPDQWVTLAWLCLWPNPCHFQAFLRSTPDTHWEKRKYLGSCTILLITDVFLTLACVTFQLPTNQSFRLILLPLPPHLTLLNIFYGFRTFGGGGGNSKQPLCMCWTFEAVCLLPNILGPGVHFSLGVLPSWADRGSCTHKCVC